MSESDGDISVPEAQIQAAPPVSPDPEIMGLVFKGSQEPDPSSTIYVEYPPNDIETA